MTFLKETMYDIFRDNDVEEGKREEEGIQLQGRPRLHSRAAALWDRAA